MTFDVAREAADAAQANAQANGLASAICIVDDGGHLIYLERLDHVPSGMVDAAVLKAQTAASYHLPTKTLEDGIAQGHLGYLNLPGVLPLEGGLPIIVDGQVIGAIAVAGGRSSDDASVARAGLAAIHR